MSKLRNPVIITDYPPEGPAPVQDGVDVGLVEVVGAAAEVVDQGESSEQRGEEDGVRGVQQPPGPRRHRHVQHAEEAHQAVPGEVLEVEVVAVGVVECDPVHWHGTTHDRDGL